MNNEKNNKQTTLELWYLGDVYESGVKNRETFNRFLVQAGSLLQICIEENILVGGVEIIEVSPDSRIVDSIWSMNVDEFEKVNR